MILNMVKKIARKIFPKSNRAASPGKKSAPGKRVLVEVRGEQSFWTVSGLALPNLFVLKETLAEHLSDDEYAYHANREKNDFARWVEDVLQDKVCARALAKAKNRKEAVRAVADALKRYSY